MVPGLSSATELRLKSGPVVGLERRACSTFSFSPSAVVSGRARAVAPPARRGVALAATLLPVPYLPHDRRQLALRRAATNGNNKYTKVYVTRTSVRIVVYIIVPVEAAAAPRRAPDSSD